MAARILVIEDEPLLSRTLVEVLREAHYSAIPACSALEGFARLKTSSFDLVILNLKLSDVDGLDMLRQIHTALPEVKVLVLIKPIKPGEVLKLIPSLLYPRYQRRKARSDFPNISQPGLSFLDRSWSEQ